MTKYKVEVDKDSCIGCGACTSCDNFEISDDNKASPKEKEVEDIGCNQEAADICPVDAIKITKVGE
ncbi:MAG: ferredoxin [Nanoarchaeota archaeon]